MINVEYDKIKMRYTLMFKNLGIGDGTAIFMKFDTGAVNTVIGLRTLFKYLSKNNLDNLISMFESSGIHKERFNSASGDELYGYPCILHDVEISGTSIKNFCFYIIVNDKRTLSLLGNDFISFCDFSHKEGGDIIITKYNDTEAYRSFMNKSKSKVLQLDEIVKDVINDYEYRKNISAGLQDLIKSKYKSGGDNK